MKKRLLASLLAAAMTLTMAPAAFAAETAELSNNPTSSITTTEENTDTLQYKINWDTEGKIVLDKDYKEDITIAENQNITLDLNGKRLTNSKGHTIVNNGVLTIEDSVGTGVVDNVSHGCGALYNKGTVTINGGTFDRSKENGKTKETSGNNSWYTLKNVGTMTINDGVTV